MWVAYNARLHSVQTGNTFSEKAWVERYRAGPEIIGAPAKDARSW